MASAYWEQLGERIARARSAAQLSQEQVAAALGLDRTAITKIEAGKRKVDTLEIARLAATLGRSVEWLLTPARPALVSRRATSAARAEEVSAEMLLEELAQGVDLLVQSGFLEPAAEREHTRIATVEDAESAAAQVRRSLPPGPLRPMVAQLEQFGLYAFTLKLEPRVDGLYLALDRGGVALVNGGQDSGRRRFTLAHEFGHHMLADEYSTDFDLTAGLDERERLINAFAIHLLMPRDEIERRFIEESARHASARGAVIALGCEYGVSWSAACAQLRNLGLITASEHASLTSAPPRRADYIELGLSIVEEPPPPHVPPGYAAAVIKAYRRHDVAAQRALELLCETLTETDLPELPGAPFSALVDE